MKNPVYSPSVFLLMYLEYAKINTIVNNSANANEIQIPFPPNTNDNAIAKPIGNMNPSSNEMIVDN